MLGPGTESIILGGQFRVVQVRHEARHLVTLVLQNSQARLSLYPGKYSINGTENEDVRYAVHALKANRNAGLNRAVVLGGTARLRSLSGAGEVEVQDVWYAGASVTRFSGKLVLHGTPAGFCVDAPEAAVTLMNTPAEGADLKAVQSLTAKKDVVGTVANAVGSVLRFALPPPLCDLLAQWPARPKPPTVLWTRFAPFPADPRRRRPGRKPRRLARAGARQRLPNVPRRRPPFLGPDEFAVVDACYRRELARPATAARAGT